MAKFAWQAQYPNIANIINYDLPNIIKDHSKFKIFKKFGGFSDIEARQALMAYSPPLIISIEKLPLGVWGLYPGTGDVVNINPIIADQYEILHRQWNSSPEYSSIASSYNYADDQKKIDDWKYTVSIARLHIESIILHEVVHWGDYKALGDDGKGADGRTRDHIAHKKGWIDLGHLFVSEAYKGQIDVSSFKPNPTSTVDIKGSDVGIDGWLGWDKSGRPF